jgi:hypothetical protein
MTEAAILEKIETLNQAMIRLQERVEDLEDLRDLEEAIVENAEKPLIPWAGPRGCAVERSGSC